MFFFEHHGMVRTDLFNVGRLYDKSFPAHLHRAFEIIYVRKGILSIQVEQKKYKMITGDLAFIFSNQIHSFLHHDHSEIDVVIFSPELIDTFYKEYKDYVPNNPIIHLKSPPNFKGCHSLFAQKSLLYGFCDKLILSTFMEALGNRSQAEVLQQILAYVDKHYSETCSLKTVAKALQYDYAYLSKLFVRLTGMNYTEYLNNYRITHACQLIKDGRKSIREISDSCGYSSIRTFNRNFRLITGKSPRGYYISSD